MRRLGKDRAFTLVEVVLALGVVAFALLPVFALLPAGLSTFREAMDISISAQIVQRVVSDAEETDFDALVPSAANAIQGVALGGAGGQFFALPLRYFDDQGTELPAGDPKIIYAVRVRGSLPGTADPAAHSSSYFTSLPSNQGARYNPRNSTFLSIQIVNNPGNKDLSAFTDPQTFLLDAAKAKLANLRLQTFSTIVARNGYHAANSTIP
jgi:uncharacterized protein (TIGR02598 family)